MARVPLSPAMKRLLADPVARNKFNRAIVESQQAIIGEEGSYIVERMPSPLLSKTTGRTAREKTKGGDAVS